MNMNPQPSSSIRVVLFFAFASLLARCGPNTYREQRLAISRDSSIPVSITIFSNTQPDWDDIYGFISRESDLFDYRNPEGMLFTLNRDHTATLEKQLIDVLRTGIKYAELTHGAFDLTILPLALLWSINTRTTLPDPAMVAEVKSKVDYRKIEIAEDGSVRIPDRYGIDLGGIAQGAISDACADYLAAHGDENFLIDVSGDILVSGLKPGDKPWIVGIEHPRQKGTLIHKVKIGKKGSRISINTSGDYEQFFMVGDKRYHHIIDPATGYPAEGVISVTVIGPTCTDTDALSTGAFVLGFDEGAQLLERLPYIEGLLIREHDGRLEEMMTSGFSQYLAD